MYSLVGKDFLVEMEISDMNAKGPIISEYSFDALNFTKRKRKNWTNFCPRI